MDVLIDLLNLIGELSLGLFVLRVGDLLLSAGLGDLKNGHTDLSGGGEGAVGVARGRADSTIVTGDAGHGKLIGPGCCLFRRPQI